jgi:hypothetical protein
LSKFSVDSSGARLLAPVKKMHKRQKRMRPEQARTRKAHHLADFFAHLGLITMHRTAQTGRFIPAETAAPQPSFGVSEKLLTLGAKPPWRLVMLRQYMAIITRTVFHSRLRRRGKTPGSFPWLKTILLYQNLRVARSLTALI